MRKLANIVLLAAATSAFSHGLSAQQNNCSSLEGEPVPVFSPRELKEVPNLVVNTSNDFRTYAQKSEEAGTQDLRDLVSSSKLEEAWIFVPRTQTWYEVGRNEQLSIDRTGINGYAYIEIAGIENLIDVEKELVVYHIHPDLPEEYREWAKKQLDAEGINMLRKDYNAQYEMAYRFGRTRAALPSARKDVYNVIRASIANRNSGIDVTNKFETEFGKMEFGLTQEGLGSFIDENDPKICDYALAYEQKIRTIGDKLSQRAVWGPNPLLMLNEMIEILNSDGIIQIKFTPNTN